MEAKQSGQSSAVVSAFLIAAFLCYTEPSFAISGSRWLKRKSDERIAYVGGVLDTWDDDVTLCEKNPDEPWSLALRLHTNSVILWSQHRPYKEIVAMVEKYLKDHPEDGERSMAGHI